MTGVYTTNHYIFLQYMLEHCPSDTVWFFSNRCWRAAGGLLTKMSSIPIVIRELRDDDGSPLRCKYRAELTEIRFADLFGSMTELRSWATSKVEFHRRAYRNAAFSSTDIEKKVVGELEAFADACTLYAIKELRAVSVPLTDLTKVSDGKPLSADYPYSYAICNLPV